MPSYDFKCEKCGNQEELWMKVSEYKKPSCCGQEMKRIFSYAVVKDVDPYVDYDIGDKPVVVKSKQHRKELMKKFGVEEKYGEKWR